jgi:PKD repeat protein
MTKLYSVLLAILLIALFCIGGVSAVRDVALGGTAFVYEEITINGNATENLYKYSGDATPVILNTISPASGKYLLLESAVGTNTGVYYYGGDPMTGGDHISIYYPSMSLQGYIGETGYDSFNGKTVDKNTELRFEIESQYVGATVNATVTIFFTTPVAGKTSVFGSKDFANQPLTGVQVKLPTVHAGVDAAVGTYVAQAEFVNNPNISFIGIPDTYKKSNPVNFTLVAPPVVTIGSAIRISEMTVLLNTSVTGADSVTLDWGDGTGGTTFAGSTLLWRNHTYQTSGIYTITVTAVNTAGSASGTASIEVNDGSISDLKIAGPVEIQNGSTATFTASAINAGNETWNWTVNGTQAGTTSNLTYTFQTPGTYTLTVSLAPSGVNLSKTVTVTETPVEVPTYVPVPKSSENIEADLITLPPETTDVIPAYVANITFSSTDLSLNATLPVVNVSLVNASSLSGQFPPGAKNTDDLLALLSLEPRNQTVKDAEALQYASVITIHIPVTALPASAAEQLQFYHSKDGVSWKAVETTCRGTTTDGLYYAYEIVTDGYSLYAATYGKAVATVPSSDSYSYSGADDGRELLANVGITTTPTAVPTANPTQEPTVVQTTPSATPTVTLPAETPAVPTGTPPVPDPTPVPTTAAVPLAGLFAGLLAATILRKI